MLLQLDSYIRLIQKEAWKAFYKMKYNNVRVFEIDDLISEGVMQYLTLDHKEEKGKVSTILTIKLQCHFGNMLKYETRRVHPTFDEAFGNASYIMDCDSGIFIGQVAKHLSPESTQVFLCIVGEHSGFISWNGRRDWARKYLKLRYKRVNTQNLLEQYFLRPLDTEFKEIGHIVGWNKKPTTV